MRAHKQKLTYQMTGNILELPQAVCGCLFPRLPAANSNCAEEQLRYSLLYFAKSDSLLLAQNPFAEEKDALDWLKSQHFVKTKTDAIFEPMFWMDKTNKTRACVLIVPSAEWFDRDIRRSFTNQFRQDRVREHRWGVEFIAAD